MKTKNITTPAYLKVKKKINDSIFKSGNSYEYCKIIDDNKQPACFYCYTNEVANNVIEYLNKHKKIIKGSESSKEGKYVKLYNNVLDMDKLKRMLDENK